MGGGVAVLLGAERPPGDSASNAVAVTVVATAVVRAWSSRMVLCRLANDAIRL